MICHVFKLFDCRFWIEFTKFMQPSSSKKGPPSISLYDLSSKLAKNLHFNALWGPGTAAVCPTLARFNWEFIITSTNPSSHYLSILFSLHCKRDHPETLPISSFSQVKCECIESWHWFQFWIFPLLEITSQFGKYTTIKASLASNPSHGHGKIRKLTNESKKVKLRTHCCSNVLFYLSWT